MFQAGVSYFVYFFNTSFRRSLTAASQSAVFIPQYFAQILLPRSVPNQLPWQGSSRAPWGCIVGKSCPLTQAQARA